MDYRKIPIELVPSPTDYRDYPVAALGVSPTESFPDEYMIPFVPAHGNQKHTSMCLAFTLAKMKQFQEWKERGRVIDFSPGFIYAYRVYGGEGMYMRVGLNILKKYGVCQKELFPNIGSYDDLREEFVDKSQGLIAEAAPQRIAAYARAWTEAEIKKSLIDNGPLAMAVRITGSFYDASINGIVPPPSGDFKGGHAVLLVGWKIINGKQYWVFSNSWGDRWGDNGFGYLPFDYDSRTEFWTAVDVEAAKFQGKSIVMHIGQKKFIVNGEEKEFRLAPFTKYVEELKGDVTFLPLRDVVEAIDGVVYWEPVNPDRIEIEV